VEGMPVWDQERAAIRCARTQLVGSPILAAPPERQRLFLGVEHFQRAAEREGPDLLAVVGGSTDTAIRITDRRI